MIILFWVTDLFDWCILKISFLNFCIDVFYNPDLKLIPLGIATDGNKRQRREAVQQSPISAKGASFNKSFFFVQLLKGVLLYKFEVDLIYPVTL